MSMEKLLSLHLSDEDKPQSSYAHSLHVRLQQPLVSCSQSISVGDFKQSEESISELVDFLNSISDTIELGTENEESEDTIAFEVLSEINRYISSPSLDQAVTDALSFELPKAVAKFACTSIRCLEVAERVINRFIETCSPRDMVSVLCEALASPSSRFNTPGYFAPLLNGLAKVFVSIQRRPFEQVKAALPVILNVLEAMSSEPENENTGSEDLLNRAICIANSLQEICVKMEGTGDKKLTALVGLFVLQIMTLASMTLRNEISKCLPMVLQLLQFLQYCGLSYLGLITGHDVDMITELISADDGDDYMSCFSYAKHGAALAVIWCHSSNEAADVTKADLAAVKEELRSNQTKRWQSVGMLKYIFACVNLPWELKRHAIDFLICIMEGNVSHNDHDEPIDYSFYVPSLYAALHAVQMVIIYASDALFRKKAFDAFKRVLADIPASLRFDILIALIKNSEISSMIAILLGCLKDEMHVENLQRIQLGKRVNETENNSSQNPSFWRAEVLDLVEFVLRPPKGGPPSLPEYSDAVLSALNLYRFVLITESSGKTNYTGVLSKYNLQKAYNEWLQPLRTLMAGIAAENQKDEDRQTFDTLCALNPVEFVLYRCIELVEENLKNST